MAQNRRAIPPDLARSAGNNKWRKKRIWTAEGDAQPAQLPQAAGTGARERVGRTTSTFVRDLFRR